MKTQLISKSYYFEFKERTSKIISIQTYDQISYYTPYIASRNQKFMEIL